jgi:hypothetical protein
MEVKTKRMISIFNTSPVKGEVKTKLQKRLETKVTPLAQQKKAVTPQEWRFIQELVNGDGKQTLMEAAIAANYKPKFASVIANKLTDPTKNPHVVAAIQQYRRDLAEKYGTTVERHMRDLLDIRDRALEAGNYSAAVQAEYRRGQALGTIYVERKEIRHGTIDSMSLEEVKRKLEEIKAMYGESSNIIDVTPVAQALIEDDGYDEPDEEPDEELEEELEEGPEEELEEELEVSLKEKLIVNKPQVKSASRSIVDEIREAQLAKSLQVTASKGAGKWRK